MVPHSLLFPQHQPHPAQPQALGHWRVLRSHSSPGALTSEPTIHTRELCFCLPCPMGFSNVLEVGRGSGHIPTWPLPESRPPELATLFRLSLWDCNQKTEVPATPLSSLSQLWVFSSLESCQFPGLSITFWVPFPGIWLTGWSICCPPSLTPSSLPFCPLMSAFPGQ
jgi:hypothetical protein